MSRLDFLYRTELPHRAVAVYIYLADRTNENNECWPAIPTIAADLKYSPPPSAAESVTSKKRDCLKQSSATAKRAARAVCCSKSVADRARKKHSLRQGATAPIR